MLNKEQQQAVNSHSKNILVLAGAGTGKTHCMIHRIVKQVSQDNIDPRSILVLTFTNAGAGEMKERYLSHNIQKHDTPEFRTFHSFCYNLLQTDIKVRHKLNYKHLPDIADENEYKKIKTETYVQLGIKVDSKSNPKSMIKADEREIVLKLIKKLLIQNNKITFDILADSVCSLFVEDDEVVKRYKERYQYIYVDEFQDTDTTQYNFVCSFTKSHKFYVGDALQNLYSFRGTDNSIIKSVSIDPEFEIIKLSQNYRSTKQICDFANTNSEYASDDYRIEIISNRQGKEVNVIKFRPDPYSVVSERVLEHLLKLLNLNNDTAILCRTNQEVSYIQYYLQNKDIAYRSNNSDTQSIYELFKCIRSDEFAINYCYKHLNLRDAIRYIKLEYKYTALDEKVSWQTFALNFSDRDKVKSIIQTINRLRYAYHNCYSTYQFIHKVANMFPGLSTIALNAHTADIDNYLDSFNDIKLQTNHIPLYIGTIHSSKGLEYDEVYVINVGSKSFRLTNEDNNNLYYVAITRAKHQLTVYKED